MLDDRPKIKEPEDLYLTLPDSVWNREHEQTVIT